MSPSLVIEDHFIQTFCGSNVASCDAGPMSYGFAFIVDDDDILDGSRHVGDHPGELVLRVGFIAGVRPLTWIGRQPR